ncbi:MBL fold metallo-hydrolase [Demequina iriomotensis]|uniref:MBL fold metallo-hydrolase n=1 Tax=Demequina iriomotensis TaxID=1536641 RepID=UPI00078105DD|nr:MBL fold metallo-hydrolase [Demequina iriomotensis]
MRLTHLGHACFLVETQAARLLIDPGVLSAFEGVRELDAVLVTHEHADHVDIDRLGPLLAANPRAALVVDADTAPAVATLPMGAVAARPGDRLSFGGSTVDVLGGLHAAVYGPVPGCTNNAYLVDHGAFLHPGDSWVRPEVPVDILAVPIDGPWLKLADAIDYVRDIAPRVAVPMHEGETTDPGKYGGMLAGLSPEGVVQRLAPGEATSFDG